MEFLPYKKINHGGRKKYYERAFGKPFLDFSACFNPLPPSIKWTLDVEDVLSYPDDYYHNLKETIGKTFHRNPDEICVGNGSIEIIRTFCHLILDSGDCIYFHTPTFGEYLYSAQLCGAKFSSDRLKSKIHFVCNPNNPTGKLYKRSYLLRNLSNLNGTTRFLFVDEAFIELSDPAESVIDISHPNLFLARSLTKAFSVPGIRFGYGFGPAALIEQFEAIRLPWTVNAYAEAFALEAFKHFHELEKSRKYIEEERKWLCTNLRSMNIDYTPSSANFILINLPVMASSFSKLMLEMGILIRDCSSFGLPNSVRIAIKSREENEQMLEAFEVCLPS